MSGLPDVTVLLARHPLQPICNLAQPVCPEPPPITTTFSPSPRAHALTLSVQPDPVTATLAPDTEFKWRYTFTLVVTENLGFGANLNFINQSHVNRQTGFRTAGFNRGANDIIRELGTNHVPARGGLNVPLTTLVRFTPEPAEALSSLQLNLTDARGNVLEFVVQSTVILPPTGSLGTTESQQTDGEAPDIPSVR